MVRTLDIGLRIGGKRFRDASRGLIHFADKLEKGFNTLGPVVSKELREFLVEVTQEIANRHGGTIKTNKNLARGSGKMIQDILDSVQVTGDDLNDVEGRIGGSFIAKVHEFGAVVRAKNGRFLTIPLPAALNSDGTPKKRSARQWENTFVQRSKAGNLIIFQKNGRSITPLYVLKEFVRIPARLGMGDTLREKLPHFTSRVMDRAVEHVLEGL